MSRRKGRIAWVALDKPGGRAVAIVARQVPPDQVRLATPQHKRASLVEDGGQR